MIKTAYQGDDSGKLTVQLLDKNEELLAEKTITASDLYPENEYNGYYYMWVYIELPDISVNIDETYYLVFKKDSAKTSTVWTVGSSEKNTYKNGEALYSKDGGVTWEPYEFNGTIRERDVSFILFGEGGRSVIDFIQLIFHNMLIRFKIRYNQLFKQ